MRAAGIAGVSRRRGPRTTRRAVRARPAPDRVERRFEADEPNRLWVADITYVPTLAGFLYLAIVLDVFSRRVVGWAMAAHLRTALVIDALEMAIAQRRPEAVVHHSDQGCQYTSLAFGARCREWGVARSMGSVGDCFDNAVAESFFATLECELLDRTRLSTHAEARAAVFEFVEGWYNTHRRHSALGYLSPLAFERLHAAGPVDVERPVEALQASTNPFEPGSPAPTRVVASLLLEPHRENDGQVHGSPSASRADSCSGPGTVSGATLWKCPARGRPPNLVLDLKVSEAGAHRPLEISRASVADHACVWGREIPTLPQRSSSIDQHGQPGRVMMGTRKR